MADGRGGGPMPWIAAPLVRAERVLDLCCGEAPLSAALPSGRWLGVDPDRGPDRPRLRGLPTAIPLRHNAVDGVAVLMALPRLHDLDAVFAEIRRVLVPGGTLALLVPSASVRSVAELRGARLLEPVRRIPWANRSALDHTAWLLQAADFAVLGDDRVSFALPLPDAAAAMALVPELARSGLWPSGIPSDVLGAVTDRLVARAGPGRVLPMPLRRLVARR